MAKKKKRKPRNKNIVKYEFRHKKKKKIFVVNVFGDGAKLRSGDVVSIPRNKEKEFLRGLRDKHKFKKVGKV